MAGLSDLIQRLERAASHEVKASILGRVRDTAQEECVRGFRQQSDPYGAPWAPRKRPPDWAIRAFGLTQDNHPLLDKTGAGINSLTSRVVGDAVVMRMKPYMKFHQTGTSKMVARQIFPEESQGLGTWKDPVERAVIGGVQDIMAGRR